mgnify:CR=1 FL=1
MPKKVRGGTTKHETYLTLISASIILISFFTAGRHDFLFSTCMNCRDDTFRKCTKYTVIGREKSLIFSIVTHSNLIHLN